MLRFRIKTAWRLVVAPACLWLAAAPLAAKAAEADLGRALYSNCAACHGAAGRGGRGPAFASNANLQNTQYATAHILTGSADMPPFNEQLSQDEIAAVLNYVRNHWGNHAQTISGADVAAVAKDLGLTVRSR
jgi:mono/diheme cytochrome c family protein